jgi:hypothetical protein
VIASNPAACLVNGQPAPQSVAPGSLVTIALTDPTATRFWALQATSTDEQNSAQAAQASLRVNQITKTATFTAPSALGSAVLFQSTVGVGGPGADQNGQAQPSYSESFKVNVLAQNGLSVLAAGEMAQQSSDAAWLAVVNAFIRSAAGSTASVWPYPVDFLVGTSTTSSTNTIKASSRCLRLLVNITTAYSTGSTLDVGVTGGDTTLLLAGLDLTVAGPFWFDLDSVNWGGSAATVQATVHGSPSAGACEVLVVASSVRS